ncbi:MAG: iron-sulfur cluster insertion protein ErpA [Hyphomicrobiales bacterium]|nr:iron-sulfur cluster insertion protein ErpA [Hyphomicrobiales bacterium]MBL4646507.1 iron-sulfur cluster insertion protein ErpA [Hyphomicrobiales bacterium]PCJ89377.1 MAG: iron-sulfur cluster insertion protein ErpA [Hyphomicrobiales bacterium]
MSQIVAQNVSVTERAAKRVANILSGEANKTALRISVNGGGCSGFSYQYDLVDSQDDDDLVLQREGATILIDAVSLPFLEGSEIDFVDNLMGQAFQINNPNATSSCGCGTSFSI